MHAHTHSYTHDYWRAWRYRTSMGNFKNSMRHQNSRGHHKVNCPRWCQVLHLTRRCSNQILFCKGLNTFILIITKSSFGHWFSSWPTKVCNPLSASATVQFAYKLWCRMSVSSPQSSDRKVGGVPQPSCSPPGVLRNLLLSFLTRAVMFVGKLLYFLLLWLRKSHHSFSWSLWWFPYFSVFCDSFFLKHQYFI